MMSNHTKTIGIVAVIFLLASVCALAGFLLVITKSESALQEKRIVIEERDAREKELVSLVQLVEKSKAERESLARYVLHDEEVINFLGLIERLGREQGVVLKTTSLNEVNVGEVFTTLEITASVEGGYAPIQSLLELFETLPYQSLITSVSLTRDNSSGSGWDGTVHLRVTKFTKL
jgi:Tfp pilus assembly protein PilO